MCVPPDLHPYMMHLIEPTVHHMMAGFCTGIDGMIDIAYNIVKFHVYLISIGIGNNLIEFPVDS